MTKVWKICREPSLETMWGDRTRILRTSMNKWLSDLTFITVQLAYFKKGIFVLFFHALSNAFYKGGVWFCVRDLVAWHMFDLERVSCVRSFIIHKYKMAASIIFCILFSFYCLDPVLSAKIAGFSSMAAGSHYFIIRKTMEELSSRGHEVNFHVKYRELPLEPSWPDLISTTIYKSLWAFFFFRKIF